MSKDYYKGGKRVSIDGVPCKVASWVGQLGNDKEFREATKPRGVSPAYYEGGYRLVLGGIPTRLAPHVKGWKAANKAKLYQGSADSKEQREVEDQATILFPSFVGSRHEGIACCVVHRDEYRADHHGHAGDCWKCKQEQWKQEAIAA
jgi:hypothetical protein